MKFVVPAIVLTFVSIFIWQSNNQLMSSSSGAPAGHSGSPGDAGRTCAKSGCHTGVVNSGTGSISIDLSGIPGSGYLAGQAYPISVTVQEDGISFHGFQLTAESPSGQKQGLFTANASVRVQSLYWATQRSSSNIGNWTFIWTAPADVGQQVVFYATGNAANGNRSSSGDRIYSTNAFATRSLTAGIEPLNSTRSWRILNNPVRNNLVLESIQATNLKVYDMQGRLMHEFITKEGQFSEDVSFLEQGIYLLVAPEQRLTERIIIE